MNAIENAQLCDSTSECLRRGVGRLATFPEGLKKIILGHAWKQRQLKNGEIIELKNLSELVTSKPMIGWGEDPKTIEAVIKDNPEVLQLFREAMSNQGERNDFRNNVTEVNAVTGNSKAYTVDRLKREAPELYEAVCRKDLSANAAAIKAGFRKKPTTVEVIRKAWVKLTESERDELLKWMTTNLKGTT